MPNLISCSTVRFSKLLYSPSLALTSPSFFELLFKFKGTVGGPRPDAPEDDVPPRSKAEEYAGGLEPDVALVIFG